MTAESRRVVVALLPIMLVVFSAFLVTGLALPVLPLHVHEGLGLGEFVVGLVAGAQFAAALLTRFWAGHLSDRHGAKYAVVTGLVFAAAAGLLYLLSLRFAGTPQMSVTVLIAARAVLGVAESAVITGALSWGLALGGADNAGKVMAWVGTAMYAAFAGGAPAGSALSRDTELVAEARLFTGRDDEPLVLAAIRIQAGHSESIRPASHFRYALARNHPYDPALAGQYPPGSATMSSWSCARTSCCSPDVIRFSSPSGFGA